MSCDLVAPLGPVQEVPVEELRRPPAPRSPVERARDWLAWFGVGRLVLIAVSVALVGAGGYWLVAPPPTPVEASLPMAAGATTSTPSGSSTGATTTPTSSVAADSAIEASTSEPTEIVVHVAGAVTAPGVVRVPSWARVADAISAAGGAAADADTDAINLAAPLHDGDRVYVPSVTEAVVVSPGVTPAAPSAASGGSSAPAGPVPINTATAEQLDALPGIGPSTAAAIVAHREQHGPFSSIDGLADVRGIGPAKLEAIRPSVTL